MVRAGEHRELGMGEQAEHLHGVLGAHDIGIPDHHHGGRHDRLKVLGPPVLAVQPPELQVWLELLAALRGHDVVVAVEVDDRRPRPVPSEETVLDPARC